MNTIAIDAMGGDHAPDEIIYGALSAQKKFNCRIILVGNSSKLQSFLPKLPPNVSIHHANEVIEMDDSPMVAYKQKKESSIHIGLALVKKGLAEAFVSAGNTGAVMSTSLFTLGRIKGVERPALASQIPTKHGHALMLDMGSTVDCKPIHLQQFALMGHFFSLNVLGIQSPKIGLLNIGEEDEKGNQLYQQTFDELKKSSVHFIGNVEGKDIFCHKADVIVCDGFVGNSILKFGEGVADFILEEIKQGIQHRLLGKIGAVLMAPIFKQLKQKVDYEEYGGAPLLGVNGVSVVAHGKSKQKAILNAVRMADQAVTSSMVSKISMAIYHEHAC